MSWIQWPISSFESTGSGEIESADGVPEIDDLPKRPVCTRALELNADALLCMLDYFSGNFIDVGKLQSEAPLNVIVHESLKIFTV